VASKSIAHRYHRLSQLRAACAAKGSELFVAELCEIDGIGEVIARAIDRFLRDPHVAVVLDKLSARGVDPLEPIAATAAGPLSGRVLVVTGTLSAPRAEIQQRITAAGGTVASAVSKKTHYLVAGADTGQTKLLAAQRHGVPVIDEAALENLLLGKAAPM